MSDMIRIVRKLPLWLACLILLFTPALKAQSPEGGEEASSASIVKQIEEESGGNIVVDIPASLIRLVEPVTKPEVREDEGDTGQRKHRRVSSGPRQTSGYRIQIFSDGRNQSTLQSRARARSNSVLSRFPKYRNQIYSFSKAPNWYTRVGNFKTQSEANAALSELRRAFPGFAGEMRVVRSNIVIVD